MKVVPVMMECFFRVYILSQILMALCAAETFEYIDHGLRSDGTDTYRTGSMNGGHWDCPWHLDGGQCADGKFYCKCPTDDSSVYFVMGCCYEFPSCGVPCVNSHNCNRWRNCQTCRTNINGSWNWKACNSCKKGYIFEDGLCDKDDNECSKDNGKCEQKCFNTYGSYYCDCYDGFRLESDKHACERLSCQPPSAIDQGTVAATDKTQPWSFASYATFACNEPHLTLDGPYALRCNANGQSLFWSGSNPACIDTCSYVAKEQRRACGADNISPSKCEELGCCYQNIEPDATKCFFDPTKLFVRYGGQKPIDYTPEHSLPERDVRSCAHQTMNIDGHSLYLIVRTGRNDTHNVDLQLCEPLSGTSEDYEPEDNVSYDFYEYLLNTVQVVNKHGILHDLTIPSTALSGVPMGAFSMYPKLRSFVSPRLVIKVGQDVSTPLDNPSCVKNCYDHCNGLTSVEATSNGDVTIYTMHLDLAHLTNLLPPHTRRVYLFAHTVVMTADIELTASLYLDTRELIIDRSRASYINLPPGGGTLSTPSSNRAMLDDLISQCVSMEEVECE